MSVRIRATTISNIACTLAIGAKRAQSGQVL